MFKNLNVPHLCLNIWYSILQLKKKYTKNIYLKKEDLYTSKYSLFYTIIYY